MALNFQAELQDHADRECVYQFSGEDGQLVAWEPSAQIMLQLAFRKEGRLVPVTMVLRTHSTLHGAAPWGRAPKEGFVPRRVARARSLVQQTRLSSAQRY